MKRVEARGIVAGVTGSPGIPPPFQAANLRYLCLDVIDLPNEPLRGGRDAPQATVHHPARLRSGQR